MKEKTISNKLSYAHQWQDVAVRKRLAKNTLVIPGKSTYPSDKTKGMRCPFCHTTIYVLVPKINPKTKKIKMVCPACGREIKRK